MHSLKAGNKNHYIDGLCFILPFKTLRTTPKVSFFAIEGVVDDLSGVDLVMHEPGGKSPLIEGLPSAGVSASRVSDPCLGVVITTG
ncbi:MAG: hypothetical protein R3254_04215, partial [Thiomicrorhabdus sp.]|nr:hypothetical protein [Thiomicrorhabdus sp.]